MTNPESLLHWLKAMPEVQGPNSEHTATLRITLPWHEWIAIQEASVMNNMTMEEVIEHVLNGSDELVEMGCTPLSEEAT